MTEASEGNPYNEKNRNRGIMDQNWINLHSINKPQLNSLILNYLIVEGYESAAVNFSKEIGMDLLRSGHSDGANIGSNNKGNNLGNSAKSVVKSSHFSLINGLQSIKQRNEIKLLLIKGDITSVIDKLNEYYPLLLENNDFLYFKILLLNLIEIIKKYQLDDSKKPAPKRKASDATKKKRRMSSVTSIDDKKKTRRKSSVSASKLSRDELKKEQEFFNLIISFVKDKLFIKAVKNKSFLHELELSMCLLLFDFTDFQKNNTQFLPKELENLINNTNFKNEVFNLINNAILNYNSSFLASSASNVNVGGSFVHDITRSNSINPNASSLLSNDFKNNNEDSKYKNSYVFYDTDSEDEDYGASNKLKNDESGDASIKPADDSIDELLFDDSDSEENKVNDNNNVNDDSEELNDNYLANNVNSKFKQLINLWIWSENILNDHELEGIPRVDLNKLLQD